MGQFVGGSGRCVVVVVVVELVVEEVVEEVVFITLRRSSSLLDSDTSFSDSAPAFALGRGCLNDCGDELVGEGGESLVLAFPRFGRLGRATSHPSGTGITSAD